MIMDPSIKDLALASEASYGTDAPTDYSRVEDLSTPDISTYKHNVNPHYIISHRGTAVDSTTATKQLKADASILFGNKSHDKLHKARVKETEKIVKQIKEKDPEHKIHLVGHSLGGSTSHEAMVKSAVVRENVSSLNTFNAGTSPLQGKGLSPKNKAYKEVASKSVHHAVQGDEISRNIHSNLIGKKVIYKPPKEKPSVGRSILRLAAGHLKTSPLGSLVHFGADKLLNTLSSHSLKNFTQ